MTLATCNPVPIPIPSIMITASPVDTGPVVEGI